MALWVEDLPAALLFYRSLGFRLKTSTADAALLEAVDGRLYLWAGSEPASDSPSHTVCPVWECSDWESTIDIWESHGGRIVAQTEWEGRPLVLAQDREGHRLYLTPSRD